MFFRDGFVYGSGYGGSHKIASVKILRDMIMLVTFENGETRVFDAASLDGEAFEPLKESTVFRDCKIEYGIPTWKDGEIDCSPDYIFEHSYEIETDDFVC
ncbi:MAG: DUF2442 domain-containing protein [Lachnospiraceae bacterium]|nr:DUF2442 domain-containing protein [Lachnospiraceae bacterium]